MTAEPEPLTRQAIDAYKLGYERGYRDHKMGRQEDDTPPEKL